MESRCIRIANACDETGGERQRCFECDLDTFEPGYGCHNCGYLVGEIDLSKPSPAPASEDLDGQRRTNSNSTDSPDLGSVGRVAGEQIAPHPEQEGECEHVPAAIGGIKAMRERGDNRTFCRKCNRVLSLTWDNKFIADTPLAASGGGESTPCVVGWTKRWGYWCSAHNKRAYKSHSGFVCNPDQPSPAPAIEVGGLIERLRAWADYGLLANETDKKTLREAADALAAQQREIERLKARVDELNAIGNEFNAALGAAEKRAKEYADLYMDRCEKWSELKEALAAAEKENAELREGLTKAERREIGEIIAGNIQHTTEEMLERIETVLAARSLLEEGRG